jgi:hypothetical protein
MLLEKYPLSKGENAFSLWGVADLPLKTAKSCCRGVARGKPGVFRGEGVAVVLAVYGDNSPCLHTP